MASRSAWTDRLFRVAVGLKGLDGAVQLIAGILLVFAPQTVLEHLAHAVVTRDLLGSPSAALAAHFEGAAQHFADHGTRRFAIVFLLLHGVIKLALAAALLRAVLPLYPVATAALALFVAFEFLRAVHTHSLVLAMFGLLDVVIIVLVLREYSTLRARRRSAE